MKMNIYLILCIVFGIGNLLSLFYGIYLLYWWFDERAVFTFLFAIACGVCATYNGSIYYMN